MALPVPRTAGRDETTDVCTVRLGTVPPPLNESGPTSVSRRSLMFVPSLLRRTVAPCGTTTVVPGVPTTAAVSEKAPLVALLIEKNRFRLAGQNTLILPVSAPVKTKYWLRA